MTLCINNLDAPLGAEVRGIDVSRALTAAEVEEIESAWRSRLVVVFRGPEALSDPQLLAFSRYFGELDPPGPNPYGEPFNKEHPEINVISNVVESGKPIGNLGDGEAVWHADMTYVDVPPKAAILHSLEVPPPMRAAIPISPTCSPPTRRCRRSEETRPRARSRCTTPRATARECCAKATRKSPTCAKPWARAIRSCAPIRRPGARRCSSAGGRTATSSGMDVAESEALLDALWAHATQPRFAMCHEWRSATS